MGEQLLAVAGSQFPNENWRGTGDADRLGRAKVRLVHRGFLKKTVQRFVHCSAILTERPCGDWGKPGCASRGRALKSPIGERKPLFYGCFKDF
ncbi:hypothetical protein DP49_5443 [Burkholderia pseudomallei]|nr:hypothetical protein DP49_5443 [Burkholderia pseudomallei]